MTDPVDMNLTRAELEKYCRQLQQTVVRWQSFAARLQGLTLEQMKEKMRIGAQEGHIGQAMAQQIARTPQIPVIPFYKGSPVDVSPSELDDKN
ncbi:MAG TPA: hypothetical protein VM577_18025 [Anaerovoracaceae bacterium]|nr:hypothetical protein [Anaerovoracaceae bacterium]